MSEPPRRPRGRGWLLGVVVAMILLALASAWFVDAGTRLTLAVGYVFGLSAEE